MSSEQPPPAPSGRTPSMAPEQMPSVAPEQTPSVAPEQTPSVAPKQTPSVAPEQSAAAPTSDQLVLLQGEDFFLNCPRPDDHFFGRDDRIPFLEPEIATHSHHEMAESSNPSQFTQLDEDKWILRATRHFASRRYQAFKSFTGLACCVAALTMLRRLRAEAWNEDILDETYDIGFNLFRESLLERQGQIRPLVLGELKDTIMMRNKKYMIKKQNIVVWGKLASKDPKVFDLCHGIEAFFKESDSGILQIPGEFETAVWYESGTYYLYHPWPADELGARVSLQGGGKGCLLRFRSIPRLCEHFLENAQDLKRKPFSISDVSVWDLPGSAGPCNAD